MMATPQPISSISSCLLLGDPETLRAFPRPASRAMSVNFTPTAEACAKAPQRSNCPVNSKSARRVGRLLTHALPLFVYPVPAFLLQFIGLAIQFREGLHRFAAFFQFAKLSVHPGQ